MNKTVYLKYQPSSTNFNQPSKLQQAWHHINYKALQGMLY